MLSRVGLISFKQFHYSGKWPLFKSPGLEKASILAIIGSATPSQPRRFRYKPNKFPLVWVKQQLAELKDRPLRKTLTLRQWLSLRKGKYIPGMHAPITKNFKKKVHIFNPFVTVRPDIAQDAWEQYETAWMRKSNARDAESDETKALVEQELEELQSRQEIRRKKREEEMNAVLSEAEKQRQAKRKARIQSKKDAARKKREDENRDEFEDEE